MFVLHAERYKRIEREKMEKNEQTLSILRHSTSHVMAQAVQKLFPSAKLAIGPAVENGFYYDFDLTDGHAFTHEDLVKIEEEMKQWKQQDEDILSYALFPQVATEFFKYRQAQQTQVDAKAADTKNGAYPV